MHASQQLHTARKDMDTWLSYNKDSFCKKIVLAIALLRYHNIVKCTGKYCSIVERWEGMGEEIPGLQSTQSIHKLSEAITLRFIMNVWLFCSTNLSRRDGFRAKTTKKKLAEKCIRITYALTLWKLKYSNRAVTCNLSEQTKPHDLEFTFGYASGNDSSFYKIKFFTSDVKFSQITNGKQ